MPRPSLVNIETALWVERIGSFSGAARKLNATQPTISLRIKELETFLQYRIFVRRGHRMLPTAEGRQFLERVAPLVGELQAVFGEDPSDSLGSRVVRLGGGHAAMIWMTQVIAKLVSVDAAMRFEVAVGPSAQLLTMLEQEKVDLIVLPRNIDYPNLTCVPIGGMRMLWVMTPDRWSRHGRYPRDLAPSLRDLVDHGPIWMPPLGSPYSTQQLETLRQSGANLKNVSVCSDIWKVAELMTCTGGLGRLPICIASKWLASGELVPVPHLCDEVEQIDFFAVWRRTMELPLFNKIVKLSVLEFEKARDAANASVPASGRHFQFSGERRAA